MRSTFLSPADGPDIKDKCGCQQGPSQTTTLLGSCCWTTPSATAPTCHSAAGTGRSCI
ncbi:hypothetical protein [Flavobacterium macrobrachii]|uniref:Natural product n=1 Tax=Flavobacterium macrobrachii TaxID=591204 RepID=A0ABS2CUS9_9FLAO|nr:hypothetical protein [Flavobacterium macrobrachii]MBM6498724.1 hypothetical protein [Flavobacterium macrobrachii]